MLHAETAAPTIICGLGILVVSQLVIADANAFLVAFLNFLLEYTE